MFLSLPARAADAWYGADAVAARSVVFTSAANASAPAFDRAQEAVTSLGEGLEDLDLGVAILGNAAPDGMAEWAARARKEATGRFLQVQRHVDLLQDDYARVFEQALGRALQVEGRGRSVERCERTAMEAMTGRGKCAGDDLSPRLAAAIDADPALVAAIAEINAVPWPDAGVEKREWAAFPLTGSARHASAATLARALARGAIDRRQEALDRGLADLDEAIAAGDSAALDRAKALRAEYERGLADDGFVLMAAVKAALLRAEKKGGPQQVALCANPAALGGCGGEDATAAVLATLQADRKLERELERLR